MRYQPRFVKQCWLYDERDLKPQGDPETTVFLPHGESLVGLYVVGLETSIMLGVRESADGQPLSCAITNEIQLDIPGRQTHADGYSGEDPA